MIAYAFWTQLIEKIGSQYCIGITDAEHTIRIQLVGHWKLQMLVRNFTVRMELTVSTVTVFPFTYSHNVLICGLKRAISISTVKKHSEKIKLLQ